MGSEKVIRGVRVGQSWGSKYCRGFEARKKLEHDRERNQRKVKEIQIKKKKELQKDKRI